MITPAQSQLWLTLSRLLLARYFYFTDLCRWSRSARATTIPRSNPWSRPNVSYGSIFSGVGVSISSEESSRRCTQHNWTVEYTSFSEEAAEEINSDLKALVATTTINQQNQNNQETKDRLGKGKWRGNLTQTRSNRDRIISQSRPRK